MKNGYAICFNEWALDKEIKNELGLILIISSLCAEKGYCYASNKYFAELFETSETLISRKLKTLENKKYIQMEYEKRGTQITGRYIRLSKMIMDRYQNRQWTVIENDKENITSINITNKKEIYKERKFKEPTLEEIENYINEKDMNVDAKTFYEYFTTSDWKDSKGNKVKNWKQKLITWNSYNKKDDKLPSWFDKDLGGDIDDDDRYSF